MILWHKKQCQELIFFFGLNSFFDVIEIPKLQNHVGQMESLKFTNLQNFHVFGGCHDHFGMPLMHDKITNF